MDFQELSVEKKNKSLKYFRYTRIENNNTMATPIYTTELEEDLGTAEDVVLCSFEIPVFSLLHRRTDWIPEWCSSFL